MLDITCYKYLSPVQIEFLKEIVEKNLLVSVYLKNSIKLKTKILAFDTDILLLDTPSLQILQISSISTITPLRLFNSF